MLRKTTRLIAEQRIKNMMLYLLIDDRIIIPHQAHLLVIEIAQHHIADVEVPAIGVVLALR